MENRTGRKIVIVGCGVAGSTAALAAARMGMSPLVIEKNNCPGGIMTSGLLAFLGPFDSARRGQADWTRFRLDRVGKDYPDELKVGNRVIGGIAEEIASELEQKDLIERPEFGYMPINTEAVKSMLETKLTASGAELLYNSIVVGGKQLENGKTELLIGNKAGISRVVADMVIDCSGDGDAAVHLGAEFKQGRPEDGLTQGVTLVFWMGGVTADPLDFLPDHSDQYKQAAADAFKRGEFSFNPKGVGCVNYVPGMPGVVMVNLQHCFGIDGTDPAQVTAATIKGRYDIQEHVEFFRRYVPGFENCFLIATGSQLGIRETRRIVGDYTLSGDDVLGCVKHSDAICRFDYDMDIHLPENDECCQNAPTPGDWYDIPYRCLIPAGIDNLLVAGRCISADHYALSSMRLMSCCMMLGQAAGTAASMALLQGVSPGKLNVAELQKKLRLDGAII